MRSAQIRSSLHVDGARASRGPTTTRTGASLSPASKNAFGVATQVAAAAVSAAAAAVLLRPRPSRRHLIALSAAASASSASSAAEDLSPASSHENDDGVDDDDDDESEEGEEKEAPSASTSTPPPTTTPENLALARPPTGRLSRLLSQRAESGAAAAPPPRLGVVASPKGEASSSETDAAAAASTSSTRTTPPSPTSLPPPTDAARAEVMRLVALLPPPVAAALAARPDLDSVIEVVMDLGRLPLARLPGLVGDVPLSSLPVTREDLDAACASVGDFGDDNRAGVDRTLHRVSALRNRDGKIVGLTCRVGRAVRGSADAAADLVSGVSSGSSKAPGRPLSVLLLGRPGVGKTTAIREIARLLADDVGRRVVVVDTSNEIAGDGDVPHSALGSARRLMVPTTAEQHRVMVEAVENHMPECVVIDEVGTEAEALACRTIAQRGVQLVATAHGGSLASLIKNPALSDLIGGIECVTLGDDEARRRSGQASGGRKTALERASPPTFDAAVEMLEPGVWRVHADLAASVDAALSGASQAFSPVPTTRLRVRTADGGVLSLPSDAPLEDALALRGMTTRAAAAAMELVMRNSNSSAAVMPATSSSGDGEKASSSAAAVSTSNSRGGGGVVIIKEPDAAVAAAVAAALSEAIPTTTASEAAANEEEDEDSSLATASYFASNSSSLSLFSNPPDTLPGPGLQARGGGYSNGVANPSLNVNGVPGSGSHLAALRVFAYGLPDADVWAAARSAGLIDEGGSSNSSSSGNGSGNGSERRLCLATRLDGADVVLALRARAKESPRLRDAAREAGVPVYAVKTGTTQALQRALRALLGLDPSAGGGLTFAKRKSLGEAAAEVNGSSSTSSAPDSSPSSSSSSLEGEDEEEDDGGEGSYEGAISLSAAGAAAAAAASARTAAFVAEARGAVEGVVLPSGQPCELRPAPQNARDAQVALARSYGLRAEVVGGGNGSGSGVGAGVASGASSRLRVRIFAAEEDEAT